MSTLDLVIVTSAERRKTLDKYLYQEPYPLSQTVKVIYLKADEARRELPDLLVPPGWVSRLLKGRLNTLTLTVAAQATVDEVVAAARPHFSGYDKTTEPRWRYQYHLYCPPLGETRLAGAARLADLGVRHGDLLVLEQQRSRNLLAHEPPHFDDDMFINPVQDRSHFADMVRTHLNPKAREFQYHHDQIFAVALYSEAQATLAHDLRVTFDRLWQWAGRVATFMVLEEGIAGDNCLRYWRDKLAYADYLAWSYAGWAQSKPLTPAAAQQVAEQLHVAPDQLPCVVVFDDIQRPDKLSFPLSQAQPYPAQFEKLFNDLRQVLGEVVMLNVDVLLRAVRAEAGLTPFQKLQQALAYVSGLK